MRLESNAISGTLEELGACTLPFTGDNVLVDCRNAENMGERIMGCRRIGLDGLALYGDVPECFTAFNDTIIALHNNNLSMYNSSGEIKYT